MRQPDQRERRRRIVGHPLEYVTIGTLCPIRKMTITELREGLDEDMEWMAGRSKPIDRTDMMSLADRQATLGEREEEGDQ